MFVIKTTGEREEFSREKIIRTCLRAGVSKETAEKIAAEAELHAYEGITTQEILQLVLRLLSRKEVAAAARYDLKGAIMRLGPAGFLFEAFVGELLKEYGYKTKTHVFLNGKCVKHEIDVITEKQGETTIIECKYHNAPGIFTGIKDILYTYARFLDVREGAAVGKSRKVDAVSLFSNTKFSSDAEKYGKCRGIELVGWRYPAEGGLEKLIEGKKLYPITTLRTLSREDLQKFSLSKLMLCKDLLRYRIEELRKLTGVSEGKLKAAAREAELILS